jgi:hypothetical protein
MITFTWRVGSPLAEGHQNAKANRDPASSHPNQYIGQEPAGRIERRARRRDYLAIDTAFFQGLTPTSVVISGSSSATSARGGPVAWRKLAPSRAPDDTRERARVNGLSDAAITARVARTLLVAVHGVARNAPTLECSGCWDPPSNGDVNSKAANVGELGIHQDQMGSIRRSLKLRFRGVGAVPTSKPSASSRKRAKPQKHGSSSTIRIEPPVITSISTDRGNP